MKWARGLVLGASLLFFAIAGCGGSGDDDGEAECGNDVCESGEATTCPQDCNPCGDGVCDVAAGETPTSCVADCHVASICGNLVCEDGEDTPDCPSDCTTGGAFCGDGTCHANEDAVLCAEDCASFCGDGWCTGDEKTDSCAEDCGSHCGDNACNGDETHASCPDDCDDDCTRLGVGTNLGQACDPEQSGQCGAGGICVSQSATEAFCRQACSETTCPQACGEDATCYTLTSNDEPIPAWPNGPDLGACFPKPQGNGDDYADCSSEACQEGLSCTAVTGVEGGAYCAPACTADTDCFDPDGEGGVIASCALGEAPDQLCTLICDPTASDCPAGMGCSQVPNQSIGICMWPAETSSTTGYESCAEAACTGGAACLGGIQGISGGPFCSVTCNDHPDCPDPDGAGPIMAACALGGETTSYCAVVCDPASPVCPTGMGCQDTGEDYGFCMWPN